MNMAQMIRSAFGAVFIGVVAVVFVISFAAIVYSGDLAVFFDRGVGLALLGATVSGIVGALTLSYRGTISQPQDVPAILLAGGVATIVAGQQLAGEVLFATVACLIATASLATGIVAIGIGRYRAAMLVRYLPYPVIAGFLAATGLLLFLGALEVATGTKPNWSNIPVYMSAEGIYKWLPVCLVGASIAAATNLFRSQLTLPICLLVAVCVFYTVIFWLGMGQEQAQASGFLLGPFNGNSFLDGIGPHIVAQADWPTILAQTPVILTIVIIAIIGTTLNASGLELALDRDLDINREVKGVGIGNTLSALVGGMPSYHLIGETLLANRLGLTGSIAGISAGIACLVTVLFGGTVLSVLPVGIFASVIAYIGIDLLYTWLWAERANLKQRDYLIVFLIPVVAITVSFLTAITVGLGLAALFFIYTYAKLDVVKSKSSVASRQSFVERPDYERQILVKTGDQAPILELSGYLFFASSNALRARVQRLLEEDAPKIRWLILDLKDVSGIDVSTWYLLQRLVSDCRNSQVSVLVAGLNRFTETEPAKLLDPFKAQQFTNLREAILHIEEALLHENGTILDEHKLNAEIQQTLSLKGLQEYVTDVSLANGEVLIEQGSQSKDIYFLTTGELVVSVAEPEGGVRIVAKVMAGSLIGEFAHYTGQTRSAKISAQGTARLIKVDMQRLENAGSTNSDATAAFHRLVARHMAFRLKQTTSLLRELGY